MKNNFTMDANLLIELAIKEDIREGDITSNCIIPEDAIAKAQIIFKQSAILCGIDIAKQVLHKLDAKIKFKKFFEDGAMINEGEIVAIIEGKTKAIICSERILLNFLQHLSAVATTANTYADKVNKYNVKILDTRKTIPGFRELEKYAVLCGGCQNHRFGLFDMVLIKDNHICAAGNVEKAVNSIISNPNFKRLRKAKAMKVELEIETLQQLNEVFAKNLDKEIDIIMLDNFSINDTKKAVPLIRNANKNIKIESSGGINLDNIEEYAKTGIDFISIGAALTLSPKIVDISLEIIT
ncbi:carboxylating nicotinate-nucleotide diphosphorylase [Candidatus Woesearchaeota archaeon]|nr:carboxylating nicotinate-nucleotide diphosphorylase [Candidatus Woesearchaeota archaeon]